jgi:hypothetical protein
MFRLTALLAVAATALALVASIGAAPAAPVKLKGSVGPGTTIVLKKGSSKVSTLKRGRYTFVVSDRSSEHNFRIKGPVSRQITSISRDRDEDGHAHAEARALHVRLRPTRRLHEGQLPRQVARTTGARSVATWPHSFFS